MTTENPAPSALAVPASPLLDLGPAMLAATSLGKEGVEVLERLHAIHKEERAYAAKAQFAEAMAGLQSEMPPVVKSVAGQHGATRAGTRTKGLYAPIDTIADALAPWTKKYGFSYRFDREMKDGKEWALCHVTHKGGHTETSRYPSMDDEPGKGKSPLHARGSGDTYARRYVLTAAFAIVTADPDDDGEAHGRRGEDEQPTGPVEKITEAQAANLGAMLDEAPNPKDEKNAVCRWMKVAYLSDIPAFEFTRVRNAIESKRAKGWRA
jgi:hypothetical protein